MYSFMKENNLPRNKKEKKLTQLLSTHGQFMSFGMYELWGLIDDCHFVVDEVETVILFAKHTHIGTFVNELFNKRITAKTSGENALCKQILNASYGSDLQNNENFANIKFMSKEKALHAAVNASFVSSLKIHEDLYLVEKESASATCRKPLQSGYATLSNAKYCYNTLVYKFMYRCLDRKRFHFIVTDTDSYMWSVAGTGERTKVIEKILKGISKEGKEKINKKIIPHFEKMVSDLEFYKQNYHLWFPAKGKKLLTLEYEHCCRNLVALAPKNYWCVDNKGKIEFKSKSVSTRGNLNQHLKNIDIIKECIYERKI
jgi:hypothetical protein